MKPACKRTIPFSTGECLQCCWSEDRKPWIELKWGPGPWAGFEGAPRGGRAGPSALVMPSGPWKTQIHSCFFKRKQTCGSHEFTSVVQMVSREDDGDFLQQLDCDFEWFSSCMSRFNYAFPNVCPSSSIHAFICSPTPLTPGGRLGRTASRRPSGLIYANRRRRRRRKRSSMFMKLVFDERCSEEHSFNKGQRSCNWKPGRKEISLSFKLWLSSPYLTNWNKTPLK